MTDDKGIPVSVEVTPRGRKLIERQRREERVLLVELADEWGVAASTLRHQVRNGKLASAGKDRRGGTLIDRAEAARYREASLRKPGRRAKP